MSAKWFISKVIRATVSAIDCTEVMDIDKRRPVCVALLSVLLLAVAPHPSLAQEPSDSIPALGQEQRISFPPVRRPDLQPVEPTLVVPVDSVTESSAINPLPCPTDTVYIIKVDTVWIDPDDVDSIYLSDRKPSRYDRRVDRFRKGWAALIPTHLKLQYAGNMGLISAGFGWDYGKKSQWETDIYLGYLPKFGSDRHKITFTLKQNYIPWSVQIKQGPLSFEPLTCGIYFNTVFGDEFWVHEPDRYPSGGYYRFSSRIRIHVFLGERLTLDIPERFRHIARQVTLFYEFSTCDLYIISAFTNKYLKPKDYLSLSFGLKLQLL